MESNDSDISSINSSEIHFNDPKDERCAPGTSFKNGSCISLESLIKLAEAYNKEHSDGIKLYQNYKNPEKYKKYLLKSFKNTINNCDNQRCWLEQDYTKKLTNSEKKKILNYTYRPEGPSKRFEWLNTLHIEQMMNQYENVYNDFKFLGAVPMDFDNLDNIGIKNLNFNQLENKGIYKLGVVFNLDEHYKTGSHWVGLYADLKNGFVCYLDSYGIPPEKRVVIFIDRILNYMKNKNINPSYDYNKIRHQYKGSECGVYSINFIIRMLRGDTFEEICNDKTPDDKINRCRNKYFINPDIPNNSSNSHCDI
jgi:hypothetical protein